MSTTEVITESPSLHTVLAPEHFESTCERQNCNYSNTKTSVSVKYITSGVEAAQNERHYLKQCPLQRLPSRTWRPVQVRNKGATRKHVRDFNSIIFIVYTESVPYIHVFGKLISSWKHWFGGCKSTGMEGLGPDKGHMGWYLSSASSLCFLIPQNVHKPLSKRLLPCAAATLTAPPFLPWWADI